MTRYDFDTLPDRRGTDSLKWDGAGDVLPMWVADMDFKTAPPVEAALRRRLDRGVFGYSVVPETWYAAVGDWWARRHGLKMQKDALAFCTGVVPAISSSVRSLTDVGDDVLIQTPVYNIFFNSILNSRRRVLESPLCYDGKGYSVDFKDLSEKLARPRTKLMLLCNPHNPVGKIWDRETLQKIGDLAAQNGVVVLSDEIHCDLTDPGKNYVPFASVCPENSVTCVSPTKAFNLAGLQTAAVYIPDASLRRRVVAGLNADEVAEPNAFAIPAAIAAFTEGEPWLEALRAYLYQNKRTVADFLQQRLPQIRLLPSEATYLLWLDVSEICADAAPLQRFLQTCARLRVSAGGDYGACGKSFLRLNIACPRATLRDGLARLEDGVRRFVLTERA